MKLGENLQVLLLAFLIFIYLDRLFVFALFPLALAPAV
jgi:hypothetical protein